MLIAYMNLIWNIWHSYDLILLVFSRYSIFRQFVISHLFWLEYLDDSAVTADEREAAAKIYGRRRLSTLSSVGKTPSSQVCEWV